MKSFVRPLALMWPGALLLTGCRSQTPSSTAETTLPQPTPQNVIRRAGEPDTILVPAEDAEMNRAMQKARKTVKVFVAALQSPQPNQENFTVKKPFAHKEGVEYIWLNNVSYDGSTFKGEVGNKPDFVKGVKEGDIKTVAAQDIADWMFTENGKLQGGYTVRVLYNRYSPEEQKAFQEQTGMRID